ncbi:carbohydrate esterase family 5 protein [Xylariaceae sp. FL0804]|nr:carbohydrate esterase family 5 protein [Xylariaceae sp. FL0804]
MKTTLALLPGLLALAAADPLTLDLPESRVEQIRAAHLDGTTSSQLLRSRASTPADETENEFLDGGCRDVILIYARGSTQDGNVGDDPGPQLVSQLKTALGGDDAVAAQGFDYAALLATNLLSGGCSASDAANMLDLIDEAASECPDAQLVVSGYSQGAALVHASVSAASKAVMAQIAAAVTFGDTQAEQNDDEIANFPPAKTLILCHEGDLVCNGTLTVTENHLDYSDLVPQAVSFMVEQLE